MPTSLTIGTDTYISLADADIYLTAQYLATDAKMISWTALSDAQCEILLRRAARIIDRQPMIGEKVTYTQTMAFPRAVYNWPNMNYSEQFTMLYNQDWFVQISVPDSVKFAQCEIAITESVGQSDRQRLQQEGVKSFSVGKLSESYGSGSSSAIYSIEAREYLIPYLAGGVRIG